MSETTPRNSATQKQAKTWLAPEQIEQIRDACLSDSFATYLQDRNETLIVLLADTGLRVSELVALDWEYLDLKAEPGELYLPSEIQKGNPGASYLDLADETRRQLRRYRNRVWKDSEALFPSRQSDRMTDRSARNVAEDLMWDKIRQQIEDGEAVPVGKLALALELDALDIDPESIRETLQEEVRRQLSENSSG